MMLAPDHHVLQRSWLPTRWPTRRIAVPVGFSLSQTCGPVAWAGGRWPNIDWIDHTLIWVGREDDQIVVRVVWQDAATPDKLRISGTAGSVRDTEWAAAVLGVSGTMPSFTDPVIERLAVRFAGLRPFAYGSLFDGVACSIIGQSISVASAAITQARIAALFAEPVQLAGRDFWPLPMPDQLATADSAALRAAGVTWRRAAALVNLGRATLVGELSDDTVMADQEAAEEVLRRLPLVGPWTARSALLWGVAMPDAYPVKDAALLRAARLAYRNPALAHPAMDVLADAWRPDRGWAGRLLWTGLFGGAPETDGK